MDFGRYNHFLAIIADANVANFADFNVLVAYLGFVGLHPFGVLEAYFDRSALGQFFSNDNEAAGKNHNRRKYPHQRQASPDRSRRHGCGQILEVWMRSIAHGGVSHNNRSSNVRAANMVKITTAPNANAPQPTATYARV